MFKMAIFPKKFRCKSQTIFLAKQSLGDWDAYSQKKDQINQKQNIIDRLLIPPSQKAESEEKKKKYEPKFEKPQLENIIKQNNELKIKCHSFSKEISQLKVKIRSLQSKITELKIKLEERQDRNKVAEERTSVYTLLLKKKIQELLQKNEQKTLEIKKMKKLPNVNLFDENIIQQQHLLAQTIRLSSKVLFLENERTQKNKQLGNNFENKFLKVLQEQNQNLKGTIRLLQNGKILMKANKSIQAKKYQNLLKQKNQIQALYQKKKAEVSNLLEENKNLLFKKEMQFDFECEEKNQKDITKLKKKIEEILGQKKKIEDQFQLLSQDHKVYKQKYKLKCFELDQVEQKYQNVKIELTDIENREGNLINFKETLMQKSNVTSSVEIIKNKQKSKVRKLDSIRNEHTFDHRVLKEVKFKQILLPILKICSLKKNQMINRYKEIFSFRTEEFNDNYQSAMLNFKELQLLFSCPPLSLSIEQNLSLSSYIFEDHHEFHNDRPLLKIQTALLIIKAAVNRIKNLIESSQIPVLWKTFLNKRKKFIHMIEEYSDDLITSDEFFHIVSQSKTTQLSQSERLFIEVLCFSRDKSKTYVFLEKQKILQTLREILKGQLINFNFLNQNVITNKNTSLAELDNPSQKMQSELSEVKPLVASLNKNPMMNESKKVENRFSLNMDRIKQQKRNRFSQVLKLNRQLKNNSSIVSAEKKSQFS